MQKIKSEFSDWIHSKRRVVNMLIGLSAVALYEIARAYYRPYIYTHEINDFHIADTLGNSLGTVATVFFFVSLLGNDREQDIFLLRTVGIAVLVYELAHPLLGKPMDPLDMLVTVLAGFFCEGLYRLIYRPPTFQRDELI